MIQSPVFVNIADLSNLAYILVIYSFYYNGNFNSVYPVNSKSNFDLIPI